MPEQSSNIPTYSSDMKKYTGILFIQNTFKNYMNFWNVLYTYIDQQ